MGAAGILPACPGQPEELCSTDRRDACPPLVSAGGVRLSQRSPLGNCQRRKSSQTILILAPFGTDKQTRKPFRAIEAKKRERQQSEARREREKQFNRKVELNAAMGWVHAELNQTLS